MQQFTVVSSKSCLRLWFVLGLFITSSISYPEVDVSTWTILNRSRKILGLCQLPKDEYLAGRVVEIVDDYFGPALFFRESIFSTAYELAIPLPFSIRSVTFLGGKFYVIRDDVTDLNPTLYSIPDYQLIGGYLFWFKMANKQCEVCSNADLPPYFSLKFSHPTCNGLGGSSICSMDLDVLYMKERLSLLLTNTSYAFQLFQNLENKFTLTSNSMDLEKRAWLWTTEWTPHTHSINRFTSVHGLFLEDRLIVNQPNFLPMIMDDTDTPPTLLTTNPSPTQFTSITSFENGGETYIVGHMNKILMLVNYKRGTTIKVGKMSNYFRNLFILENNGIIGQDINYNLYYSSSFVSDVLSPLVLCANQGIPTSQGCSTYFDIELPFSYKIANRKCFQRSSVFYEGSTKFSSRTVHASDANWHAFENYHHYYISTMMMSFQGASSYCSQFHNEKDASHLAIVDDLNVATFLASNPNFQSPPFGKYWVGGSVMDQNNTEWKWLNGVPVKGINDSAVSGEDCLYAETPDSTNITWGLTSCSQKAYFICEKYKVCWDIFPNVKLDMLDLMSTPDDEDISFIFNFGTISSGYENPIKECGQLCQNKISQGCISFTYIEAGSGDWSGKCFGRNGQNMTESFMQSSPLHFSGILRQCASVSVRAATHFTQNAREVSCSVPGANTVFKREVFSVVCGTNCRSHPKAIHGSDPYSGWSSICRSAIHAGVINDTGGRINAYVYSGQYQNVGSTKHGITSNRNLATATSFTFDPDFIPTPINCSAAGVPYLRPCAPSGATDAFCLARGCCPGNVADSKGRTCYHRRFSGYNYTTDGWLKSPYSSYEYAVVHMNGLQNMSTARVECQKYGDDLVYAGISEETSYRHVYENILYTPYHDVRSTDDSIWLGLVDDDKDQKYEWLNGKIEGYVDWYLTEPSNPQQQCAMYMPGHEAVVDIGCNKLYHGALCQRVASRCNLAVESRLPCAEDVSFIATKEDCSAQGCCYVESLDGNDACFKPIPDKRYDTNWQKPTPADHHEYALIESVGGWQKARLDCMDRGGILAYTGFGRSDTYNPIVTLLSSSLSYNILAWFAYNDFGGHRNYTDLSGNAPTFTPFGHGQPDLSNISCLCMSISDGYWYDVNCSHSLQGAICQRPTDSGLSFSKISCESSGFGLCAKHGHVCHKNASCIEHFDWMECLCNEGFLGDGETTCVPIRSCPTGWHEEDTGCYFTKVATASFFEAEEQCQGMGSHLISLTSTEEYNILKKMLNTHRTAIKFWIGLRWNHYGNKSNIKNSTCGRWTDGTEYIHNSTIFHLVPYHECFAFNGSNLVSQLCSASLVTSSPSQVDGFVCKIPWNAPLYLDISMTSYSRHTYPGYAEIVINNRSVLNVMDEPPDRIEKGCIYIVTFSNDGHVIHSYTIANNDSDAAQDMVDNMMVQFMKEGKEVYFALATAGEINLSVWEYMSSAMIAKGFPIPRLESHRSSLYVEVNNKDFSSSELASNEEIYKCNKCQGTCDGVGVFKSSNIATCRSYPVAGGPSTYEIRKISSSSGKYVVKFRSKTIKSVTAESSLSCPWLTEGVSTFGIRIRNIKKDERTMTSTVRCTQPPCVHQIGCLYPEIISSTGNYEDDIIESVLMFCKRLRPDVFVCPINETGSFSTRPLHVNANVSVIRAPMLATFDDLTHLGSPPFEFGSLYGLYNATWKPMMWTWKEDRYGIHVPGVRQRAIRFSGEQVHSTSDVCWWKFDDNATCPHGFTVAFWIRVMEWPSAKKTLFNTATNNDEIATSCHGLQVYFKQGSHSLVISINSKSASYNDEVAIELGKWTHVWFRLNLTDQKLQTYTDWHHANPPVGSALLFAISGSTACDNSKLYIGSSSDGVFDLDDFQIFSEALDIETSKLLIPESSLPLRYHFIDEVPSNSHNSMKVLGEDACLLDEGSHACGSFASSCLGSVVHCLRGFSLGFTIKLPFDQGPRLVMITSNLPHTAYIQSFARSHISYGFRVDAEVASGQHWNIKFYQTFNDDPVYDSILQWKIEFDQSETFWLQYHPEGVWLFCFRWPNNCLKQTSKSMENISTSFVETETYTNLNIGPSIMSYNSGSSEFQGSRMFPAEITNLWFIEQAFDLSMLADEIRKVSSPLIWRPEIFEYSTPQGHTFQKKGKTTNIQSGVDIVYGWRLKIQNDEATVKSSLDSGYELSTSVGWLETNQEIINNDCLFDIDDCTNGFTFQMIIKTSPCISLFSGEDHCYYVSTGGQATPLSRGFSFFRSSDEGSYHVIVATSKQVWKMDFISDLSSDFVLIRISWHADVGLSLFLNDIPFIRVTFSQPVVLPDVHDEDLYNDFLPFPSLTIGRRNDLLQGFSTFELGEFIFWEGLVEGFPTQSIGRHCVKPWSQIGESCYSAFHNPTSVSHAETTCKLVKSELAHFTSLSAFQGLKRYLSRQISPPITLWTGLYVTKTPNDPDIEWKYMHLPYDVSNYNSIAGVNIDATSASHFVVHQTSDGYQRQEMYFSNQESSSPDGYLCAMPLSQDYLHRGCYTPHLESETFGYSSSDGFFTHDLVAELPAGIINSLGDNDIPHNCRRSCYLEHGSLVSVVKSYKCFCLSKLTKLSDITSRASTITDKHACSKMDDLFFSNSLEFGFSILNSKHNQFSVLDKFTDPNNCGPYDNGGVFKCGSVQKAAIYGLGDLFSVKDISLSPLKQVELDILGFDLSKPLVLNTLQVITIVTKNLVCESIPVPLNQDDIGCKNSSVVLNINYGNGSMFSHVMLPEEAENFQTLHFYNTSGEYVIQISIKNSIGEGFTWTGNVEVPATPEKVVLNYVQINATRPNDLTEIMVLGIQGTYFTCTWDFGDKSQFEKTYYDKMVPLKNFHRFRLPGIYTIVVTCGNSLQYRSVVTNAYVQEPIVGLRAESDVVVHSGNEYTHQWRALRGSHVNCLLFIGNHSVQSTATKTLSIGQSSYHFDQSTNRGLALLPCPQQQDQCYLPTDATSYTLLVTCFNAVTNPSPTAITNVKVEFPITEIITNITHNTSYIQPAERFCISISVATGSNVILGVTWENDEKHLLSVIEYCGLEKCETRAFCVSHNLPGTYMVNIKAFNPLGIKKKDIFMSVETPVSKLKIEFNPAPVAFQQSEIILSHSRPLPKGSVLINYGDGIVQNITMLFDETTTKMSVLHRYPAIGFYNVSVTSRNNVSSSFSESQIQIGIILQDLKLTIASARIRRSQLDSVLFIVSIANGSIPRYKFHFGYEDKPPYVANSVLSFEENSTRNSPDLPDIHYIEHIYSQPGNYTAFVQVENIFGKMEVNSTEEIIVQNPLIGGKYKLEVNAIPPVAFPPGTTSFNVDLVKTKSQDFYLNEPEPDGWANDVHITWVNARPTENIVLQRTFASRDLDLFPYKVTFNVSDVGDVNVYAELSNLVSSIHLHFSFTMMEQIDGILVIVSNTEGSSSTVLRILEDPSLPVLPSLEDPSSSVLPSLEDPFSVLPNLEDSSSSVLPNLEDLSSSELPMIEDLILTVLPKSLEDLSASVLPNLEDLSISVLPDLEVPFSTVLPNLKNSDLTVLPNDEDPFSTVLPNNIEESSSSVLPNLEVPSSTMLPNLKNPASTVLPKIEGRLSRVLRNIEDPYSSVVQNNNDPSSRVLTNLEDSFSKVLPNVEDLSSTVLPNSLEDQFSTALPNMENPSSSVLSSIEDPFSSVLPSIEDPFSSVLPSIEDPFSTMLPNIEDLSSSVLPDIEDLSSSVLPDIEDLSSSVLPNVEDLSSTVLPNNLEDLSWSVLPNLEIQVSTVLTNFENSVLTELPNLKNVDGNFVDASVMHELTFRVTVAKGSHVTYRMDFGDGAIEYKSSPVLFAKDIFVHFTHSYETNGTYTIEITATNHIDLKQKVYSNIIRVYEKVDKIEHSLKQVDYDESLYQTDIFEAPSEVYVLTYGKSYSSSGSGNSYFPLDRPIHFHAGALKGSNATMTIKLLISNISISLDQNQNIVASNFETGANLPMENGIVETDAVKVKPLGELPEEQLQYLREEVTEKIDTTNYLTEISLLLRFANPGREIFEISVTNPISSKTLTKTIELIPLILGLQFKNFEPPVANRTSNISFTVQQIGTDTCFKLDPGDFTYEIAFGFNETYCVEESGMDPNIFYELPEDISQYKASDFSFYSFEGKPKHGLAQLNFTLQHVYAEPFLTEIKLTAFNRVSQVKTSRDVAITEILCDYPSVSIEKQPGNSLSSPRQVLSFLEFRVYTLIRTNCKLTSLTNITWQAYQITPAAPQLLFDNNEEIKNDTEGFVKLPKSASAFVSQQHNYRPIPGLAYTSNSEDITIKSRFLDVGMHLICVNVAMLKVIGINTTDCVFIKIVRPPLIAGIALGIRRAVGYGQLLTMDALSASYDPDQQTLADVENPSTRQPSTLLFKMSCPFAVENSSADGQSLDEKSLMFSDLNGWSNETFCEWITIDCGNAFKVIEFQTVRLVTDNNPDWNTTVPTNINSFHCVGDTFCNVTAKEWLANHFMSYGYNISDDNSTYCLEISFRCRVPAYSCLSFSYITENSDRFDFVQPNKPCIPSGYYPKLGGRSSASCFAITSRTFNECGIMEIDSNLLQSHLTYMVRVEVIHPLSSRMKIGSQAFQFTLGEPPKLRINCIVNCDIKVNPRTTISVGASRINEFDEVVHDNTTSPIVYKWSLLQVVDKQRRRRDTGEEDVDLLPVLGFEAFAAIGTQGKYFVIQPGLLEPMVRYRIQLVGSVVGASPGLTETELSLNLSPYNGDCSAAPQEGLAVNETFTISCTDWKDEGINVDRTTYISPNEYSLVYQIYYRKSEDSLYSLLLYGSEPVVTGLFLPPGLEKNDFKVWIQVRIVDEYGAQASVNLTVRVLESSDLSNDKLGNITSTEIATSNAQSIAQLSSSVSEILNQQAETSSNASSVTNDEKEVESQVRSGLRSELVDAVVGKINTDSDLDGIQQVCSTLTSLTAVSEEVTESTQIVAIDALSERTNLLSRLSDTKTAVDVEETASMMIAGFENVVKSAQSQMVSNLDSSDSHSSLVPQPIFSEPPAPHISSKIVLDEEENFLSPEEREERRLTQSLEKSQVRSKNRNQTKTVGLKALSSVNSISGSLLKQKIPGEPVVRLKSQGMKLEVQKSDPAELCRTLAQNISTNSTPSFLSSILLSSHVDMSDCDAGGDEEAVETELLELSDNPYIWDGSADFVRSSVVSLSFKFPNGTKPFQGKNNSFRLELPVNPTLSNVPSEFFNFVPSGLDNMSFHELSINQPDSVTFLAINPHNSSHTSDIKMRVYFLYTNNLKDFPNVVNYTFSYDLPDYGSDPSHPYRIRLDNSSLEGTGRYVYGILQVDDFGNITSESQRTLRNYTLHNMATSCRFWNESTEQWETTGCTVSSETNNKVVVCLCNHLTSFGADFLVAPNPIDFSALASKLQNIKDNLAVLMTIIGLFVLYVVGIIACRRQDKKDISKWSVSLLMDNNLSDHYFYQVTIQTGSRRDAETASRIFFMVSGVEGETTLRVLADKEKTKFERGSTRKFLMAVDKPLGVLSFVKIWHDNSGKRGMASWYLDHVVISDLRSKMRYYFFCNEWLAVDQSDGSVERILPVATDNQLGSFKHVFASSTKKDFSDGHLWFSLFSRPTKSNFTRVQRLTCALTIFFSTMLTSAMFFGRDEDNSGTQGAFEIGPIRFTVQQLLISIEATLLVVPINVLLVQLFRRAKAKDNVDNGKGVLNLLNKSVESIDKEIDENEGKEKNESYQFPHWVVYIAWCLAVLITLTSATFVFLYSVEWGAAKAQDWLLSIFLSFFQSIFVIQPAKVILAAVVLSFFVNRCRKEDAGQIIGENDEEQGTSGDLEEFKRKEEEWLLQMPKDNHLDDLQRQKSSVNNAQLQAARQKCLRDKIMVNTIRDIISYFFYVVVLITAANSTKDPQAFRFHRSLSDVFLAQGSPAFEMISTPDDFWNWCENGLVAGLHASNRYNNERITWSESRFITNRETFVVGPARIRQLRVEEDACIVANEPSSPALVSRDCIPSYNWFSEDTRHFLPGWAEDTTNLSLTNTPWAYQDFMDLGGFPYHGLRNLYSGGGYAVTLGNTAKSSREKLATLKAEKWIDRFTAAVFIEFTVYNANVNLFGSLVLLLEKSSNGAFFAHPVITPLRLYEFIDGKGYFLLAIYFLFVVVLVYNMWLMMRKIYVLKKKFFHQFWNVVDTLIAIFSIISIAFYGVRTVHSGTTLAKITADVDKETFVNFQYIVFWNDIFRIFVSFTVFLATVKFSKLLHFNRRIRLLTCTLKHAAKPVLYFSAMFLIYFAAFMFLANMWFEQKLYAHSSLYLTAVELFSMLLGRFDFTELQSADQLLGPLFFIAFTGTLTITVLNMFICILDDSIKKARAEVEGQQNEFEVIDYMMKQFSEFVYTHMPPALAKAIKTEEPEDRDCPVYIEFSDEVLELRVDALEKYVTKMESEFYATVTLEELEADLEEDEEEFADDIPKLY